MGDEREPDLEELRRDIVVGCEDMADVYLEIEKEFHPLEEEVECLLATEDG